MVAYLSRATIRHVLDCCETIEESAAAKKKISSGYSSVHMPFMS